MGIVDVVSHPVATESLIAETAEPLDWQVGAGHLARAGTYWLASVRPDGGAHVMPVLAVWDAGRLHFCTSPASQKARNLAHNAGCVITASSSGFDLVLDGNARRVTDESVLQRVAAAYDAKYGWRVTVRDGAFHDAEGAPTAGPPPYEVYAIAPVTAYAFGTSDETVSAGTRWRFSR